MNYWSTLTTATWTGERGLAARIHARYLWLNSNEANANKSKQEMSRPAFSIFYRVARCIRCRNVIGMRHGGKGYSSVGGLGAVRARPGGGGPVAAGRRATGVLR